MGQGVLNPEALTGYEDRVQGASPGGSQDLARRASPRAYSGHQVPASGPPRQVPSDSPGRLIHR
ncbi:hypothetical protein SMICM304S_06143 [Streptomyces microflavus]